MTYHRSTVATMLGAVTHIEQRQADGQERYTLGRLIYFIQSQRPPYADQDTIRAAIDILRGGRPDSPERARELLRRML